MQGAQGQPPLTRRRRLPPVRRAGRALFYWEPWYWDGAAEKFLGLLTCALPGLAGLGPGTSRGLRWENQAERVERVRRRVGRAVKVPV